MLTDEAIRQLKKPFSVSQHRWVQNNPYILKEAIRERLYEVDSRWTNTPPEILNIHGDSIILRAGLTVCEVTRFAIGTGIIQSTRKVKRVEDGKEIVVTENLEGFELAREQNKAYKSADSDLLPRCAIEFGVGAYLKDKPKDIKSQQDFSAWINKLLAAHSGHWAFNGGRQRFTDAMKEYQVRWADVATQLEPGRTLHQLSDTTLSEEEAMKRLLAIIEEV